MLVFIETERLSLRRLAADDLDNLVDLDSDPAVMRYLNGGHPTPRSIVQGEILPRFLRGYDDLDGLGHWAAIEKATGEFLGWFGMRPSDRADAGDLVLGYRLRRNAWGKGYATEVVRKLIRKAFVDLGAERVSATTYQDNLASRRVLEKAGLRLVRAYRLTAADLLSETTYQAAGIELWDGDDLEYALLRAEWELQQRTLLTDHADEGRP